MNGFFISVSNGLLSKEHRENIGTAVWEFMWCLDKITKIDDKGEGHVWGGKPVNLSEVAGDLGVSEDTISRNLHTLEESGYIRIIRTPYGLSIRVQKAKKRFRKNVESNTSDKNAVSLRKNAVCNIRQDTQDNTHKTAESNSADIVDLIDLFKPINPSYQKWFANKTQREACKRLIETHGMDKLRKVVLILPKTNRMPYIPTITTPLKLEDSWASLEASMFKKKQELESKEVKNKVAFS